MSRRQLHTARVEGDEGRTGTSRYSLALKIASGGMGTVYLGHLRGAAGFERPVAIKRAHPHLLGERDFVRMLLAEARNASLVRHPNVVSVLDVEEAGGELLLIMEYVEGGSLSQIAEAPLAMPISVALRLLVDASEGLAALHALRGDEGDALQGLIHRDVSPQNVLVGVDGFARITDFGIAKAYGEGPACSNFLRGKPAYMAPEYIEAGKASPASDVFGLGIIGWELLSGRRLFKGPNDGETLKLVRSLPIEPPSRRRAGIPKGVDEVILKALERRVEDRYQDAGEMAAALGKVARCASRKEVSSWLHEALGEALAERRAALKAVAARAEEAVTGALPRKTVAPRAQAALAAPSAEAPSDGWLFLRAAAAGLLVACAAMSVRSLVAQHFAAKAPLVYAAPAVAASAVPSSAVGTEPAETNAELEAKKDVAPPPKGGTGEVEEL